MPPASQTIRNSRDGAMAPNNLAPKNRFHVERKRGKNLRQKDETDFSEFYYAPRRAASIACKEMRSGYRSSISIILGPSDNASSGSG